MHGDEPVDQPVIRAETPDDRRGVRFINEAAFGTSEEADLVEALRLEGAVLLSLVAELEDRLVGHILFSRMWLQTAHGAVAAVALAPMAVLPRFQRRGVGGRLIRTGLDTLRAMGERIVIVVGHPDYYPRHGFSSELARALEGPFPREAFMALELTPGALDGIRAVVRYPQSFGI